MYMFLHSGILAMIVAVFSVMIMLDSPTEIGCESFTEKKEEKGRLKGFFLQIQI